MRASLPRGAECRPHYDQFYLCHDHSCLPEGGRRERGEEAVCVCVCVCVNPLLFTVSCPEPCPPLITASDNRDCPIPPYCSGQEIGCYMPHRGDFAVVRSLEH